MLKQGDPVTVAIVVGGRLCAAHARVSAFYRSATKLGFYFVNGVVVSIDNVIVGIDSARATGRFCNEEGVTWARGHQTGDAIVALLAAAALAGAIPEEPFDHDYSSAGWHYDFDDGYLDDNHPIYKEASWRAR